MTVKRVGNPALTKGVVLNPKGRPKGSLGKNTLLAREMMGKQGPAVVQKVIDMAMEGDVHCLKIESCLYIKLLILIVLRLIHRLLLMLVLLNPLKKRL